MGFVYTQAGTVVRASPHVAAAPSSYVRNMAARSGAHAPLLNSPAVPWKDDISTLAGDAMRDSSSVPLRIWFARRDSIAGRATMVWCNDERS